MEQKLTALAALSKQCTIERRNFVGDMIKNPNSFEADISHALKELHNTHAFWEHSRIDVLDPIKEATQWDQLCALCAREAEKADAAVFQVTEKMAKP